jgi:2-C-methyl-D-erythritol 4-phosphate cytidylyltransferase / 2-C-methyl-D-erythritol 2,4-cyclodiphosphate synthase
MQESKVLTQVAVIIVAAGNGLRAGGSVAKQFQLLARQPVLAHTLTAFLDLKRFSHIVVITGTTQKAAFEAVLADLKAENRAQNIIRVDGGTSRQSSVKAGLEHLAITGFDGTVLIHDGARPFVSSALIERAITAASHHGAAIPALPLTDTIKRIERAEGVDTQVIAATLPRESLRSVQTPQAFVFKLILDAHRAVATTGVEVTDDASIIEATGGKVVVFPGEPDNIKLTHAEDFTAARLRLEGRMLTRVATGYDVHAFTTGDHVWLGGIRIAHDQGVLAHSDGDVVLHALTDALLGVCSEGDIGTHFPPSDPQWRGASSDRFLAFAVMRIRARGGIIDHLDISIICEAPKIGPRRAAMITRIAQIAGIAEDQVSLKATTSEKLGFIGRREGLAAFATATIRLPQSAR